MKDTTKFERPIRSATIIRDLKNPNKIGIMGFIEVPSDSVPRSIYMVVELNENSHFGKGYACDRLLEVLDQHRE